jgi:hypothetical protein
MRRGRMKGEWGEEVVLGSLRWQGKEMNSREVAASWWWTSLGWLVSWWRPCSPSTDVKTSHLVIFVLFVFFEIRGVGPLFSDEKQLLVTAQAVTSFFVTSIACWIWVKFGFLIWLFYCWDLWSRLMVTWSAFRIGDEV